MDTAPDASQRPPRRRRWGRLVLIGLVCVVLPLVVIHLTWSHHAGDAVERKVAALRAAGEPMLAADLPRRDVPDDRNVAVPLREAHALIDKLLAQDSPFRRHYDLSVTPRLPLSPAEAALLRAAVAELARALDLIAQAQARPAIDWGESYVSPMLSSFDIDRLGVARRAALALNADALLAMHDGDHARAVDRIRGIGWTARQLAAGPFVVNHITVAGIVALETEAVQDRAPALHVDDGAGAVRPADVRAYVAELLDDTWLTAAHRHAWRTERMMAYDSHLHVRGADLLSSARFPASGPNALDEVGAILLRPMMNTDAAMLLDHLSALVAATDAPTHATFEARVPTELPALAQGRLRFLHALSWSFVNSTDSVSRIHYRTVTDRRLAATALAVRLYQADHGGRLPPTLDALVPDYLPAVPTDAQHGHPLIYKPDAPLPVVYARGPDGDDDGGAGDPDFNWNPGTPDGDVIVHLVLRPRAPDDVYTGDVYTGDPATQPAAP